MLKHCKVIGVLFTLGVMLGCGSASQAEATVQSIVDQVSRNSYAGFITNLLYTHIGNNRAATGGAQHDLAAANIFEAFRRDGLTTMVDPFVFTSGSNYNCGNIIGIKQGIVSPGNIYIFGAHFDSASTPGADDNASGTAAVLEAARVMAKYDFSSTLIFTAFDCEDTSPWYVGSTHYANAHQSDNIKAMIAIDCVCYDAPTPMRANLWGRDPLSTALKNTLAAAMSTYGGITTHISGQGDYSDHRGFEAVGKPATMLTEDGKNQLLHTLSDNCDNPGYMNYEYGTAMTRGAVGYLAEAAGLIPGQ